MMIGQKTKISAPDFTRSSIDSLKQTVHGAPIIVDDLTNTRFSQHAIETIKNDDFGIAEHLVNYPAVVISANEDVKAVAPEVIRRTVICRVQAGLTNTEVMSSNIVRTVQREVGTALYREYLRQMLEIVPELLEFCLNIHQYLKFLFLHRMFFRGQCSASPARTAFNSSSLYPAPKVRNRMNRFCRAPLIDVNFPRLTS